MQPYLGSSQEIYHFAVWWKNLSHPNLVPPLGVSEISPSFGLVTPRMPGNIIEYTREHQDADRLLLVGAFWNQRKLTS